MLVRLFSHLFFDSVIRYFVSIPFSLKWFDVIDTVVNVNELELEKPSICIKWRILTANIIFEPHIHWQVVGNRRYVFKSLYFSFFFVFWLLFQWIIVCWNYLLLENEQIVFCVEFQSPFLQTRRRRDCYVR